MRSVRYVSHSAQSLEAILDAAMVEARYWPFVVFLGEARAKGAHQLDGEVGAMAYFRTRVVWDLASDVER